MREGRVSMAVVIPPDFERRLQSDTRPVVQILVDGSQPTSPAWSAASPRCRCSRATAKGPYSGGKRMAPRRIEIRTLYNPEKRTAVQIVPALIGVILTMTMVLFTSGAIVRERERGNLELLIATPLGRLELMVGKLLPYVVIGLIQTTIILIVGALAVQRAGGRQTRRPVRARRWLFIAATLGLGLFVSTLAQTQFQAFQLAFLTMLPSILLSGLHVPVRRHARGGAVDRADAAAHAFQRDHPRHHAARRRPARGLAAARQARGVPHRHAARSPWLRFKKRLD